MSEQGRFPAPPDFLVLTGIYPERSIQARGDLERHVLGQGIQDPTRDGTDKEYVRDAFLAMHGENNQHFEKLVGVG